MSDIFVSYANEDRSRAQRLAQEFERRGWSVFWDRQIPAGKSWREVITAELSEASSVVVLWSKFSVNSRWVQEEADDGQRRGVLVPVLIDDVLPPIGFRGVQAADLSDWGGAKPSSEFERLISEIDDRLAPHILPATRAERGKVQSASQWADRLLAHRRELYVATGAAVVVLAVGALLFSPVDSISPTVAQMYERVNQGDAAAQHDLAWALYEGNHGLDKDNVEAFKLFKLAAEQGHANAQGKLGWFYEEGIGIEPDSTKSVYWNSLAADAGDTSAMNAMGWSYWEGRGGLIPDPERALDYFQRSCDGGYGKACMRLGWLYRTGQHVVRDYDKAERYYLLAISAQDGVEEESERSLRAVRALKELDDLE